MKNMVLYREVNPKRKNKLKIIAFFILLLPSFASSIGSDSFLGTSPGAIEKSIETQSQSQNQPAKTDRESSEKTSPSGAASNPMNSNAGNPMNTNGPAGPSGNIPADRAAGQEASSQGPLTGGESLPPKTPSVPSEGVEEPPQGSQNQNKTTPKAATNEGVSQNKPDAKPIDTYIRGY